jgi:hypothetical protein
MAKADFAGNILDDSSGRIDRQIDAEGFTSLTDRSLLRQVGRQSPELMSNSRTDSSSLYGARF